MQRQAWVALNYSRIQNLLYSFQLYHLLAPPPSTGAAGVQLCRCITLLLSLIVYISPSTPLPPLIPTQFHRSCWGSAV